MTIVKLALYRPHKWNDLIGRSICAWTRSPYSHCELVIDGDCYSSSLRDGGVRRKRIDLDKPWWDVVHIPWADAYSVREVFAQHIGEPYGYLDLIGQHVFRIPWHIPNGWLCSEICAAALGLNHPQIWTPGMLADYAIARCKDDHHSIE